MLKISPATALLQQQDFLTRSATPRFQEVMFKLFGGDRTPQHAHQLMDMMTDSVSKAETYIVTPDMCDVLEAAADALDDSDKINLDLLPSPHGLVYFEKAFRVTDVRGQTLEAHRMTWTRAHTKDTDSFGRETVRDGLYITWWNDMLEPDVVSDRLYRMYGQEISKVCGRWAYVGSDYHMTGDRVGSHDKSYDPETVESMDKDIQAIRKELEGLRGAKQHKRADELVKMLESIDGLTTDPDSLSSTNMMRIAHALFLMMNQTISAPTRETAPKSILKGLRRLSLPESVTVVKLRHAKRTGPDKGAGAPVQWSHRWLVKGHWAWRHCGENHPLAQPYEGGYHCRLWVNGFVKGPEDKPFKITRKVYKVAR